MNGKKINVKGTIKEGDSIIHIIEDNLDIGDKIHGFIDWNYRYNLMTHHTGTHVVNSALRKNLGEHIWQAGSQISEKEARFDFSHYKKISKEEIRNIEKTANNLIKEGQKVEKIVADRNTAERKFGFRLYQGGVPPGDLIRIINIPNVDVEACGGTHLNNIAEVEQIKILRSERIQDGVNRITFSAGKMVDLFNKEENNLFNRIIRIIESNYKIKNKNNITIQLYESSKIFSVPINQLEKTIKRFLSNFDNKTIIELNDLTEVCHNIFINWKEREKIKKKKSSDKELFKKIPHEKKIIGSVEVIIIENLPKLYKDFIVAGQKTNEKDNRIVIIGSNKGITIGCSKNLVENKNFDCSKIIIESGKILGGGGGGSKVLAQAGGPKKENIKKAIDKTFETIKEVLK